MKKYLLIAYVCYLAVLSLIAYVKYAGDKKKARQKKRRVPESTLLSLGTFGGAAGALLAMKICRHKTKHWYFWAANLIGLVWQTALLFILLQSCLQT